MSKCKHDKSHICPTCRPDFWESDPDTSRKYAIRAMRKVLLDAKHRYYCKGKSHMTDAEYDAREHSLRVLSPKDEFFDVVGCALCSKKPPRTIDYKKLEAEELAILKDKQKEHDKKAETLVYTKNGRKSSIVKKRPPRTKKVKLDE